MGTESSTSFQVESTTQDDPGTRHAQLVAQEFQIQPHQVPQNVGTEAAWVQWLLGTLEVGCLWKDMIVLTLIVCKHM